MPATGRQPLPQILQWTPIGRVFVFFLAAMSIWCLLAQFYGLCTMRAFTFLILIPATAILIGVAFLDRARGNGQLCRAIIIGAIGGLFAACAYDLFRLPFV